MAISGSAMIYLFTFLILSNPGSSKYPWDGGWVSPVPLPWLSFSLGSFSLSSWSLASPKPYVLTEPHFVEAVVHHAKVEMMGEIQILGYVQLIDISVSAYGSKSYYIFIYIYIYL